MDSTPQSFAKPKAKTIQLAADIEETLTFKDCKWKMVVQVCN